MFCEQLGNSQETTIILTIVLQQVSVVYMTYFKQNTWRKCLIFSYEVAIPTIINSRTYLLNNVNFTISIAKCVKK